MTYREADGWRKVAENGASFVVATLYNILTGDETTVIVRDYDYADCSRDNDAWYDAPIDKAARRAWYHKHGVITDGSRAMVIKGRKVPAGYVGVVDRIKAIKDRYGRWVADYVIFSDGKATNMDNCVLVLD